MKKVIAEQLVKNGYLADVKLEDAKPHANQINVLIAGCLFFMINFYHMGAGALKDIKSAYRVAVKGLVRDELGRLLFVQERSDSWDLPGGGLEHGEDITEALKREFLEELDTDIEVATENPLIIPTWNTKFDDPVLIIAYKVTLLTAPRKTDEVSNFNYFDIHEIKQEKLDSTLIGNLSKIYQIDR